MKRSRQNVPHPSSTVKSSQERISTSPRLKSDKLLLETPVGCRIDSHFPRLSETSVRKPGLTDQPVKHLESRPGDMRTVFRSILDKIHAGKRHVR